MKKSINIKTLENGQKYLEVFEVRAIRPDGTKCVYDRFLSRELANKKINFIHEGLSNYYVGCYVVKVIVWC